MTLVVMAPGWQDKVARVATRVVHDVGDAVHDDVRAILLRHVDTGALLASLRTTKTRLRARVFLGTDHWSHFEYGTRPHTITPRTGKALRFTTPRGVVIVAKVRHPGTRAYAPLRRSLYTKRPLSPVRGL